MHLPNFTRVDTTVSFLCMIKEFVREANVMLRLEHINVVCHCSYWCLCITCMYIIVVIGYYMLSRYVYVIVCAACMWLISLTG
jgi:hypothetical protein